MAATRKGVWDLQEVRDKQLASEWTDYVAGGKLFGWGSNVRGSLGTNQSQPTQGSYSSPIQIGSSASWNYIGDGPTWSDNWAALAIKSDGTLWSWGYNTNGELGQNNRTNYSSPTQVPGSWTRVATNSYTTGAIKTDGTLWSWGNNSKGHLGLNQGPSQLANCSSPTQVGVDTTWSAIAQSTSEMIGIKTDGTLWSWGYNLYGSLGLNQKSPNLPNVSSPTQVGTDTTWANVKGGPSSVLATKTDGTLWSWGNNDNGQNGWNLPGAANRSSPTQIPGTWNPNGLTRGRSSAGCIKADDTLWVWGSGTGGQNAQNDTIRRSSPIQIPGSYKSVGAGYRVSGAIKTDGTQWMWGSNTNGALGQNDTTQRSSPIQVGTDTSWTSVKIGSGARVFARQ